MDFKITIMLDATDRFQACIENLMMLCIQNVCKYYLKWDGDNLLLIPKSYLKGIKDIAEHGQLDELYDYEEGKPYLLH